ncbi:MAG TPA: tyrosine-type recombinase/integrase, partial [Phycisphaerae bacterium]|nr:tyrosine-type recombinase/integrase [Phycisphaerae bacterium]
MSETPQVIENKTLKKRKSRGSGPAKYLTEDELRALLGVIRDPRDRCIFVLSFWRGLRASEVGILRLENYSPRTGRLYVRRLKNSVSQEYRLTPEEEKALKSWLRVRGKVPGVLFPGYKNRGLGRRQLDKLMKRYGALAEIPMERRHFHCLKHSIGTYLFDHDEPVHLVQDHLG